MLLTSNRRSLVSVSSIIGSCWFSSTIRYALSIRFNISSKFWLEIPFLFLNQFIARLLSHDPYIIRGVPKREGDYAASVWCKFSYCSFVISPLASLIFSIRIGSSYDASICPKPLLFTLSTKSHFCLTLTVLPAP
jgi:hypothetical protein